MIKEFQLSDDDKNKILSINKEGGDPVMYLSGGIPLGKTLQVKINDLWSELGNKYGFEPSTVRPIKGKIFSFTAECKE